VYQVKFYCFFQNEEFTIYSDYAENYMEAVMMLDKLVSKPGAPEYLGVSKKYMFVSTSNCGRAYSITEESNPLGKILFWKLGKLVG